MNDVTRTAIGAALAVVAASAAAGEPGLAAAIANGETSLGIRYRFEHVDQAPFANDAQAQTARARLTWTSEAADHWSLGVETDYNAVLGEERFNSTANGRTEYPVVPDPEGLDLNQAFVKYADGPWSVTAGRQRITHGNHRVVANVGFRQNEQTYDALRLRRAGQRLDAEYTYLHNVNRIFGPEDGAQPADWHGNSHLLRASGQLAEGHRLAAFAYFLDFVNGNGPLNSNATHGLEYDVQRGRFGAHASVARQTDWGANPATFEALHYALEVSVGLDPVTVKLGVENLGSDSGAMGFRTPLATLHKFQGWTDRFLVTPNDGLVDRWVSFGAKLGRANATIVRHDFRADDGGARYGAETGLSLAWPVHKHARLLLKAARYTAEAHATDTTKVWVMLDWSM